MKHILLNNLGSKHISINEIWPAYVIRNIKKKFLIQENYGKYDLETRFRPFLILKESSVKRNLRESSLVFDKS